eukprot:1141507-Pelagomonas_calceolata.AAC.2
MQKRAIINSVLAHSSIPRTVMTGKKEPNPTNDRNVVALASKIMHANMHFSATYGASFQHFSVFIPCTLHRHHTVL